MIFRRHVLSRQTVIGWHARQILSSAVLRASDAGNMEKLTDEGGDKHGQPASQNDAQLERRTGDPGTEDVGNGQAYQGDDHGQPQLCRRGRRDQFQQGQQAAEEETGRRGCRGLQGRAAVIWECPNSSRRCAADGSASCSAWVTWRAHILG